MSDQRQHALLSPSGASRWMKCPGSVALEAPLPETHNEYSDEGTCAHAVAAMCLTEGRPATAYIGRRIEVGPHRTYEFREDMAEPTQEYVDKIAEFRAQHELHVEVELPIDHITGEQDASGTGDAIIITEDQTEIQVHDLKFGMGVAVSAEENPQLKLYALGALRKFDVLGEFQRVRMVIHQPRLGSVSEWDCTVEELLAWAESHAKPRAFHARQTMTEKPGAIIHHLKPADDTCRFCKAKATCPALATFVRKAIDVDDFDVLTDPEVADSTPLGTDYDVEELAAKMKACDLIEVWIKAIRAEVERNLLAGTPVPGFKLVEGRMGNRAWSDKDQAEALLKSFRLKQEEMYDFRLISPTSAEKVLKDSPKRWKKAEALITRAPGAKSVAPESDKRPAIVVKPAIDDFDTVTDDNVEDLV
jgi:hypothetical protein